MTKAVERERLAVMLFQERKLRESRKDPRVLLSPRAYGQTILQRPIIKEATRQDPKETKHVDEG
jgi:hypothetical protein